MKLTHLPNVRGLSYSRVCYSVTCQNCWYLIWSPYLIPGPGYSGTRDGWTREKWIWSISPSCWVWQLRNARLYGMWCQTELLWFQSVLQPWLRYSELWLLTNINGCLMVEDARASGASFVFLGSLNVGLWVVIIGMVGFYDHESLCCFSHWLCYCVWLRSVSCRPKPRTWRNIWSVNHFPDLVRVTVVVPTTSSDHSLSAVSFKLVC